MIPPKTFTHLIVACLFVAAARAATIPVSEDTSSARAKLTLTANKATTLPVDATHRAFLYFDLAAAVPAGSQLRYARLRLYFPRVTRVGGGLTLHKATGSWDERLGSGEPAFDATPLATFPADRLGSKRFLSLDVTAAVQGWLNTPASNEGFAVAALAATSPGLAASVAIGAKEGAGSGYPAELDIEIADDPVEQGSIGTIQLAPNLTLGGTTIGTFNGNLSGSATTFTGSLAGDVTGTQSATVVSAVGGVSAANIAAGANLANTTIGPGGNLSLPMTNGAGAGVITQNGTRFIHSFGTNNFFAGPGTGNFSMGGAGNTGIGANALQNNSSGGSNTALGWGALLNNSTGFGNVALGHDALLNNTEGFNNIAIGQNSASAQTTGSNNVTIANSGIAGESNAIRIGTPGSHAKAFVAGVHGVTTGINDAITVRIDSNGQLGTVSSSRRYKEDIADMGEASARLRQLRPVTFRYKQPFANGEKPVQFGLIAEEVAAAFPELAVFNAKGEPETVKYDELVPLLLNEVQKLDTEKETLKKETETLRTRLERLEALVSEPASK